MQFVTRVEIRSIADIFMARQKARSLGVELGFKGSDLTMISIAISEVARNIVTHAKVGEIVLTPRITGGKRGLCMVAHDQGPGIIDLKNAMCHGYSTRGGLGIGLSAAKSLMDEFKIKTTIGKGTIVTMNKWLS
jgi:serine/threonine-protein kinase RsbT